eukprot:705571-Pleurochrysis_carterae.AAC.2
MTQQAIRSMIKSIDHVTDASCAKARAPHHSTASTTDAQLQACPAVAAMMASVSAFSAESVASLHWYMPATEGKASVKYRLELTAVASTPKVSSQRLRAGSTTSSRSSLMSLLTHSKRLRSQTLPSKL